MKTTDGESSPASSADIERMRRLRDSLNMLKELRELVQFIHEARSEIAAIRPDEIKNEHLSVASDELDAIVSATEEATNEIMEAAEAVEQIGESLPEAQQDAIADAVTRIYQACSFQDITGQRISKVVGALKHIEGRVERMLVLMGADAKAPAQPAAKHEDPEAKLLNGPQLPGNATSQDEIDALFG